VPHAKDRIGLACLQTQEHRQECLCHRSKVEHLGNSSNPRNPVDGWGLNPRRKNHECRVESA
jgi:hypothetical protein